MTVNHMASDVMVIICYVAKLLQKIKVYVSGFKVTPNLDKFPVCEQKFVKLLKVVGEIFQVSLIFVAFI